MSGTDWTVVEVEALIADYLAMLSMELAGVPYNKTAHRRALVLKLNARSEQSIEFKHANVSATLLDLGFPYIAGYKPRSNYQQLLGEVVAVRLFADAKLLDLAASDADRPIAVPELDDILAIVTEAPHVAEPARRVAEAPPLRRLSTNYLEREARNRSLGAAGEEFVIAFERERLSRAGRGILASKIEHTSRVRGDYEGYDILSFEVDGQERLIEVKTTKYGRETPFFVSRNEIAVSERQALRYQVYRMYSFRESPRLYTLAGAITLNCNITPENFLAVPR